MTMAMSNRQDANVNPNTGQLVGAGCSIEEKTRRLLGLGWVDTSRTPKQQQQQCARKAPSTTAQRRKGVTIASSPYQRRSTDSEVVFRQQQQQLTPPPSPMTTTLMSPQPPQQQRMIFECSTAVSTTCAATPSTSSSHYSRSIPNVSIVSVPARRTTSAPDFYGSLPVSPVSPNTSHPHPTLLTSPPVTDPRVFDRMRQLVPHLSADKSSNAYRVLLQTVGNVVELEHQLQHLKDQTHQVMMRQQRLGAQKHQQIVPNMHQQVKEDVPADLADVDITAFQCMMHDTKSCPSDLQQLMVDDKLELSMTNVGLDPLTVDTSFQ